MIDVHTFDGKLKGIFNPKKIYTIEEKEKTFEIFKTKIRGVAIFTLETIIDDMKIEFGNNFQKENEVDASDILMDILNDENYPEILSMLEEQLVDIKLLGFCNSGRVTRLLQIWCALKV